ncbi:hypothetical protein D5086_022032 [Populus alba]|uniref:Uncharacterized protein n=1 Tax=Populus alba TaxID=43335 RepID=A0ACC4BDV0_POPAL
MADEKRRHKKLLEFMPNPVFDFTFVSNNVEVYYTFNLKSESTVITRLVPGGGQELYIRMHASEIGDREAKAKMKIAAIATAAFVFILGILTISYHILKEKAKFAGKVSQTDHLH